MAEISETDRQAFLDAIAAGSTVVDAAPTNALRRRFYHLRSSDTDFRAEWDKALQEGLDTWIRVAHQRATEGVVRRRSFDDEGNVCVEEIVYSDALLMFLIKQRDPSFRENSKVELTGGDGKPVEVKVEHTVVDLARVVGLLGAAGVLGARPAADAKGDEVHPV